MNRLTDDHLARILAAADAVRNVEAQLRRQFDPDLLDCRAVEIGTTSTDRHLVDKPGILRGFSLRETTGANPARAVLRDGLSATAPILTVVNLNASESIRDPMPDIAFATGVFLDLEAGSVEGAVYVRTRP